MKIYKTYYFVYYLAYLVAANYLSLYTTSINFTPADAALFSSFNLLMAALGQLVFSLIADKIKDYKSVLKILTISVVVISFIFPLSHNYVWVYLLSGLFGFTQRAMIPVFDTVSSAISTQKKNIDFGKVRAWGAYGAGIASLVGILFNYFDVSIIFNIFAILHIILFIIITTMDDIKEVSVNKFDISDVIELFKNSKLMLILLVNFILYGVILVLTNTGAFLMPYLEQTISVTKISLITYISMIGFIRIFTEGFVMDNKHLFIDQSNIKLALYIGTSVTLVRVILLAIGIDSLLIQGLISVSQALCLGVITPTIIVFITNNVNSNCKTTAMSLYAISISISGMVFNNLLSKLLVNNWTYNNILILLALIVTSMYLVIKLIKV